MYSILSNKNDYFTKIISKYIIIINYLLDLNDVLPSCFNTILFSISGSIHLLKLSKNWLFQHSRDIYVPFPVNLDPISKKEKV